MPASQRSKRSQNRSQFHRRLNASDFQRLSNISRGNVQHTSRSRRGRVRNTIRRFVPNLQTEINRENAILAASHIVANNSNQLPVIRRYEVPPYFTPQVRAMRVDVRQLIDRINFDIDASITQQSSSIVQKIIGVTDRSDIEVGQGATSQMKHIRNRLMTFRGRRNIPWVYNSSRTTSKDHNDSIRTIDEIAKGINPTGIKCYGTSKPVHFNPNRKLQLKNEWEHLVPNLYQLLINGLAYTGDKSMSGLLKLALGNIFGQNSDNIYKEFENICYLAQNRCLILSAKAFNQAKCSYMLFKVDYVDYHGNGNYIIELSVDNDIVDIVYERMRDGRRSKHRACYHNDPKLPNPPSKSVFKGNLIKVANEYNSVMRENFGYFGKIIFACGCISAAMLAYNCPNGRHIYNTAVGSRQNLPLVYYMAKNQIAILRSLVPVIGVNPAILTGGALSTADGLNDLYRYPNYNKMDMPSYDLTPIQEHLSPVSNVPTISPIFSKGLTRRYKNSRTRTRSKTRPKISKTRSKIPKTLSKRMTFSNSPLNVNKESVEVNENDISDSHEFLKGSIDILNRLFTDKRIIWDNDLYSYRFKKSQSAGGRRKTTRRTRRRTKRR